MAKLIGLLNDPQLRAGRPEVKNFRQYVLRVAANACHDYLRAKSPARNRLKNNLRDLLERHPDFAIWRVRDGEPLCGFTAWLNHGESGRTLRGRSVVLYYDGPWSWSPRAGRGVRRG